MTTPTIPTFRQYVDGKRREAAARHGIPLTEAAAELPETIYRADWRAHVVQRFNDGDHLPTRLWRTLDEGLRYRILRSHRALRDDALTRQLRDTAPDDSDNSNRPDAYGWKDAGGPAHSGAIQAARDQEKCRHCGHLNVTHGTAAGDPTQTWPDSSAIGLDRCGATDCSCSAFGMRDLADR